MIFINLITEVNKTKYCNKSNQKGIMYILSVYYFTIILLKYIIMHKIFEIYFCMQNTITIVFYIFIFVEKWNIEIPYPNEMT